MKIGLLLLIFIFQFSIVSLAQSGLNYEDLYLKNIPLFQDIVSGGYYVDPPKEIEGHPHLESRNLETGKLTINGITYNGVPLSYNIFTDELITFQPVHNQKILIRSDKINSFEINLKDNRQFVLVKDNPSYTQHKNGIYELLETGEAKLLRKHYKLTKAKREVGNYTAEFYGKSDFLIQNGGKLEVINKPRQAFKFLDLDKKAIKSRIRKNSLNFRNDPESYLGFLIQEYNQEENQ